MTHAKSKLASQRRNQRILVVVLALLLIGLLLLGYTASWTGFASYQDGSLFFPAKRLWDWLDLLIVPAAIGIGLFLLNRSERNSERAIELDRQRQTSLETYFDCMTELLLNKALRTSELGDEVRSIARTRTLAVFRVLDADRKAQALQFLYESELIGHDPIVPLTGANLRGARLNGASLMGAEIRGAHLQNTWLKGANLTEADLRGSDLSGTDLTEAMLTHANLKMALLTHAKLTLADFSGANLEMVDLSNTDLRNSKISDEQIESAGSIREAKLPVAPRSKFQKTGST